MNDKAAGGEGFQPSLEDLALQAAEYLERVEQDLPTSLRQAGDIAYALRARVESSGIERAAKAASSGQKSQQHLAKQIVADVLAMVGVRSNDRDKLMAAENVEAWIRTIEHRCRAEFATKPA